MDIGGPSKFSVRVTVSVDDRTLITECLEGRPAAFGELVHRYQNRLYNTVLRMIGNSEDAQDVVQEAFLHAYQSLASFKGDSLFFTWIYRIAINTAISLKRKQKSMISIDGHPDSGQLIDPLDSSESSRPGHALEMAEEEQSLRNALARLSPEHRTVLVLKDIEGHKYEEMAELLEVPIGTIRSRLHRARLELRELLQGEESSDDETNEANNGEDETG